MDKERIQACVDIFRAAAASVVEMSRDYGLTPDQYRELAEWLPALTKLFKRHALERKTDGESPKE
jgi:hypothetical protein